jgi:hypothetical protein
MKVALLIPGALLGTLAVAPCHVRKVEVYQAKGDHMSGRKTHEWLPPRILASSGIVEGDSEVTPLIKPAANRELQARGFREVRFGGDLPVATFVLAESVPQLGAVVFPRNLAMDFATPIPTMGRYNRGGTLAVNLINLRTRESAWAGMARENLKNKPGTGREKIPHPAAKLFETSPVKPPKRRMEQSGALLPRYRGY